MHLEKNYTNVKTLLIALKCDQFNWQVIGLYQTICLSLRQEFKRIQATAKLLYQDFCSKGKSWYFCWPTDKKDPRLQRISCRIDNRRAAWNSFAPVVRGFLGNHKT